MLTKLPSKPITQFLFGFAAVLLVGALIGWGILAWAHLLRINITRSEYEQALAKWQAQKVEEYEITTDTRAFSGGIQTLHVSDYGNKVEEVAPNAGPFNTLTAEEIKYLKEDTVEGLFAKIDASLKDSEIFKTGAMRGGGDCYMVYQVTFHPYFGYPDHYVQRPSNHCPTDMDWDETVTNIKIIKQGK